MADALTCILAGSRLIAAQGVYATPEEAALVYARCIGRAAATQHEAELDAITAREDTGPMTREDVLRQASVRGPNRRIPPPPPVAAASLLEAVPAAKVAHQYQRQPRAEDGRRTLYRHPEQEARGDAKERAQNE